MELAVDDVEEVVVAEAVADVRGFEEGDGGSGVVILLIKGQVSLGVRAGLLNAIFGGSCGRGANCKQEGMEPVCKQDAGEGTHYIGEPIEGIVASTAGVERLVVFVERTDEGEEDKWQEDAEPQGRGGSFPQQYPCGEGEGAAHEVSEVDDLIEVRDLRAACGHRLGGSGEDEKSHGPGDEACEPGARGKQSNNFQNSNPKEDDAVMKRRIQPGSASPVFLGIWILRFGTQGFFISSSSRSASHCFIIDW